MTSKTTNKFSPEQRRQRVGLTPADCYLPVCFNASHSRNRLRSSLPDQG